jgi:hypothetical protein
MHNHNKSKSKVFFRVLLIAGEKCETQFDSLPLGLLNSAGVEGNEKSTGDGGGAGVSLMFSVLRDAMLEALKAALTS